MCCSPTRWAEAIQRRLGGHRGGQAALARRRLPHRGLGAQHAAPADGDQDRSSRSRRAISTRAVRPILRFTEDAEESAEAALARIGSFERVVIVLRELRHLSPAGPRGTLGAWPATVQTLAAIDVGTNSLPPRRGPASTGDGPLRGDHPREGDGAPRLRRRRHEAAHARRHRTGASTRCAACSRSPTSHDAPVRAVATSAVREAENHDEFVTAGTGARRASRSRSSPASRRRGSSTSACCRPCPCSTAGCSCATSAAAAPSCSIGERGEVLAVPQLQARRGAADQPLLPRRAAAPRRRSARAGRSCAPRCRPFSREVGGARLRGGGRLVGHHPRAGRDGSAPRPAASRRAPSTAPAHRRRRLATSCKELIAAPSVEAARAELPGLDANRADIILAGALILEGVFETFGIEELTCQRLRPARGRAARHDPAHPAAARSTTCATCHGAACAHLAELCDDEPEHSAHVAAASALDAVRRHRRPALHGLDERLPRVPRGGGAAGQRRPVRLPQPAPPALVLRDPQQRDR